MSSSKPDNGKGDSRRPSLIDSQKENENWERAMPGSTRVATWYYCPVCNKGVMNYRNPCKVCPRPTCPAA